MVSISYLYLLSQQLSKAVNTLIFSHLSWFSQQQLSKASYKIIFLLHDVTVLISHFSFLISHFFFFITVPKSFFPFQFSQLSPLLRQKSFYQVAQLHFFLVLSQNCFCSSSLYSCSITSILQFGLFGQLRVERESF